MQTVHSDMILEQIPAGVALFGHDGELIRSNRLMRRFFVDDILSSPDDDARKRWRAFKNDGAPLPQSAYPGERALRGDVVLPGLDFIHTSSDGKETWTRVSAAPFRSEGGQIAGAVVVVQDIDQEKRAERAMRDRQHRFQQFADHSSNVLWILDARTHLLEYLSPAYEAVWGRPLTIDGVLWEDTVQAEDRDRVSAARRAALEGDLTVQEYRIVRPDGGVRWIRDTMFPMRDHAGRVQRIGGIAEDVRRGDGQDPDPA